MAVKKSELYSSIWQSCDELRGGMDASQYKDYVLVLLFVKYVSDKAATNKGYLLDVPEGGMRHLIDTYIQATDSAVVSTLGDLSLVQLIVQRGAEAVKALPAGIRSKEQATAETIENNVRKLIIDEAPINPKYYERMSALLDALIAQRKEGALGYQEYLAKIVELTREAAAGPSAGTYPLALDTPAKRALFDNLGRVEALALRVDQAGRVSLQGGWRTHPMKTKRVRQAIAAVLGDSADSEDQVDQALELVKSQNDY